MLEIKADAFSQAIVRVENLKAHVSLLVGSDEWVPEEGGVAFEPKKDAVAVYGIQQDILKLREFLVVLDVRASIVLIDEIISTLLDKNGFVWSEIDGLFRDLGPRIRHELKAVQMYILDRPSAEFFEKSDILFGVDVANGFPSIAYDIAEAGKCLAFGRSTAAAFHSIRCLESGILALSRCLGIPDPSKGAQRSWARALEDIQKEIEKRWRPNLIHNGDGEFFPQCHAVLSAMQNPYRNSTMHLDQKYTLEEATHILELVKGFMRKLASRCDENGIPKLPLVAPL